VDHAPYRNVVRKYEKLTKWHRAGLVGAVREKDLRFNEVAVEESPGGAAGFVGGGQSCATNIAGGSSIKSSNSSSGSSSSSSSDTGRNDGHGAVPVVSAQSLFPYVHQAGADFRHQQESQRRFSGGGVLSERNTAHADATEQPVIDMPAPPAFPVVVAVAGAPAEAPAAALAAGADNNFRCLLQEAVPKGPRPAKKDAPSQGAEPK
jgi:hypothetical protein